MRYLGLALFAEGPTDHDLLRPVLERLTTEVCLDQCRAQVEIGPVEGLPPPTDPTGPREERILEAALRARDVFHVLFVHADGTSDPEAARGRQVAPAVDGLRERLGPKWAGVGVVPIRETEAWTLVDGDALRRAFGTQLNDEALGLPRRGKDAERLTDPKAALQGALDRVVGKRSPRRRRNVSRYYERVGNLLRLENLRSLPAFKRLEADLAVALEQLGYAS